ncbi:MAG TPA: sigma-70 family RNA polymerase sigma factor [Vicinamibacterales bacterium]|nr:sigma-70 family RNA polymerase sigma factor [Vicinamibacterales bacterium]
MQPDDAAVIAKARDGDHEAFRVLVDRHGRNIYRLAYRMTGKPEDAEDVVQDTFVRAFQRLDRFEARSNFATWLYRIGFNCAIDYMRSRQRRETPEPPATLEILAPTASGPSMDDLVYAGEIDRRVRAALQDLSEQERAAFLLRHYHGCSIEEICEALDLKTNAAKHSIFRAVRKMRTALGPLVGAPLERVES